MLKAHRGTVLALSCLMSLCGMEQASAQEAPPPADISAAEIPEVVVSAQKREQRIQDVPLSVSVVSAQMVQENHIDGFGDIAKIAAGFTAPPDYGFIELSAIRGIGTNGFGFADDPSIGIYVDGVYQGLNGGQENALYDIDRIEVIKGPQATLFGRSSIAGAISVTRARPKRSFDAELNAGVGDYGRYTADGFVNIPLPGNWAMRFSGDSENEDGYFKNLAGGPDLNGRDIKAARVAFRWFGSEVVDPTFTVNYERRRLGSNVFLPLALPDWKADIAPLGDANNFSHTTNLDLTSEINVNIAEAWHFKSLTSYRRVKNDYQEKSDGLPQIVLGPYGQFQDDRLTQQEFRLSYQQSNGLVVMGGVSGYLFRRQAGVRTWVDNDFGNNGAWPGGSVDDGTFLDLAALAPGDFSNAFREDGFVYGRFTGWSVYGDTTIPLAPRWKFTGGVRYSADKKFFRLDVPDPAGLDVNAGKDFACACYNWGFFTSTPLEGTKSWNDTSLRGAINYELNEATTAYFTVSQGYKAGSFNTFVANTPPGFEVGFGNDLSAAGGTLSFVNPEHANNYELGLKGSAFERRLGFNVAAYRYYYRDLQKQVQIGPRLIVSNVGRAQGEGVDLELTARPVRLLTVFANVALSHTRVESYEPDPAQVGLPLNYAPRWSGAGGGDLTLPHLFGLPGDTVMGTVVSFRSRYRNDDELTEQVPGYALVNFRLTYHGPDDKYSVAAYVDNAFDKLTFSQYIEAGQFTWPLPVRSAPGSPRRIGLEASYHF